MLEGLKMYDAAVRLAVEHGCAVIGIQYQHGLQGLCVASDLAEGLLNNPDRPPVRDARGEVLLEGQRHRPLQRGRRGRGSRRAAHQPRLDRHGPRPRHDAARRALGRGGSTERGVDDFVWVFEISGAVPPNHLIDGYRGAVGERQPPMYFRARRLHHQGHLPARGDRLEPHLRRGRRPPHGHRPRRRGAAAGRGEPAALGGDDLAVADDARGALRRHPRPVHGQAQGQPHPGGLRPRRRHRAARPW